MPTRPVAEVTITPELVHSLLAAQHPDLAALPVGPASEGWDNVTIPLGDTLAIRLPRRTEGVELIRNEQRWLPRLAAHSPLPIPAPLRTGTATPDYPWPWSVVPWFEGKTAASRPVGSRAGWATTLAEALGALHAIEAPSDAPRNPVRGGDLHGRETALTERVRAGHLDDLVPAARDRAAELWRRAVMAPRWPHAPRWVHGDPHPANLLVRGGRLVALLDFGDMTAGDPACDLATAWLTFDHDGRDAFRSRTDPADDPALWDRAAGWALVMASAMCAHSDDDPVIGTIGRHAVRELLR